MDATLIFGTPRRAVRISGWLLIGAAIVELCAREVARASIIRVIGGPVWPSWALALMATAGGVLVSAATNRRGRGVALFAVLFAAGVTLQLQFNVRSEGNGVFHFASLRSLLGLVYGLLGAWFCYRLACRFYGAGLAVMATTCVFMGSFMLWYMVKEPTMNHAPSMAAVAGFIWAWVATRPSRLSGQARSMREWALLGALAGLMTLIRLPNALFAILPACDALVILWISARLGDRITLTRTAAAGLLFAACTTMVFVPQMIAWKAIRGSYFGVLPIGAVFQWADPHISDILWSSRNGLLSTSPILYAGAIGVGVFAFAQPSIGVPMLLAAAAMTYVNASFEDWWGGDGFGMRRFDGLIPMMTIGVAALSVRLVSLVRRFPTASAIGVFGTFAVWNLTLMSVAHEGRVRLGEAVSFGDVGAAQARAVHRWIGMPLTYPASLLFAWQGNVSPADYDLLWPNRMLDDPRRPYGRIDVGTADDPYIEQGWYVAERDGADTFRWTSAKAIVRVPLDHAASLRVQVRLRAFTYSSAPPQQTSISINGRQGPVATIGPAWQVIEFATDDRAWHAGINRLALDFAWAARPADVGVGGDRRLLAGAVDYVSVEVIGDNR